MLKSPVFIFFVAALCLLHAQEFRLLKGSVKVHQKGIKNVVITNGQNFTTTDQKGNFVLESAPTQDYIYYTLPSGYVSPEKASTPLFYKKIEAQAESYDFELIPSPQDQDNHILIALADPQVIDSSEFKQLSQVIDDVNQTVAQSHQYAHAISLGDLVFDRHELYKGYKAVIQNVEVPFYQLIGNHDMDYSNQTNESSAITYKKEFGPDYYSYNVGEIHYVILNDVFYYGYKYFYMGYLDQLQADWLKKDLSYLKKGSTVVISLHIPTKYYGKEEPSLIDRQNSSMTNNTYLYDLLGDHNVHILAGHSHTQWNTVITPIIMEHVHAAASGAWWQGEICQDGSPKGYTVYSVKGDSFSWYFKGVGNPKEDQFKVYPVGSDVDNPAAIIANVYNYDPQWKVFWYENDIKMGEMEQFWGIDPMARAQYQPGKNKKYSWLSYGQTNHLFKAIPKNKNTKIHLEVIDRFGTKYVKKVN